jgi:ABC-type polysaccharide/polyol phosphate export permease
MVLLSMFEYFTANNFCIRLSDSEMKAKFRKHAGTIIWGCVWISGFVWTITTIFSSHERYRSYPSNIVVRKDTTRGNYVFQFEENVKSEKTHII